MISQEQHWRCDHKKEAATAIRLRRDIVALERFPKRLNRDSHDRTNMIQASCWSKEASMDGEAIFGGFA